jgi:MSHA pilin protein MshA
MKQLTNNSFSKQKGFTLIELVVVIVILGILAVTAAPKFIDIQDDAKTATLQAVKASMQSAATLVHSKSLIEGNEDTSRLPSLPTVKINGKDLLISYGYPIGKYPDVAVANWTDLIDVEADFNTATGTIVVGSVTSDIFYVFIDDLISPATVPSKCYASYTETNEENVLPTFKVEPCT